MKGTFCFVFTAIVKLNKRDRSLYSVLVLSSQSHIVLTQDERSEIKEKGKYDMGQLVQQCIDNESVKSLGHVH